MESDVCKHCTHAACLDVCPTGALFRTEFGTVVVQDDICNGCGYCVPACPFGVIDRRVGEKGVTKNEGIAQKCTLCYDRIGDGLEPACAKACPTTSIQFGDLDELRERAEKRVEGMHEAGTFEDEFGAQEFPSHEGENPELHSMHEWESGAYEFGNQEVYEDELGAHEFGNQEVYEDELGAHELGNREGVYEDELGAHELGNQEGVYEDELGAYEDEFEVQEFGSPEADPFLGRAFKRFSRSALRRLGKIAKGAAPFVAGKLFGMIPGAGVIAGPLAAKLTSALVREGEASVLEAEAHLFGTNEMSPEIGGNESSQEAALTEMLAAEAAATEGEAEAVSVLSASLPVTITIMGGRRRLRRVMPALTQANTAMVQALAAQGPAGRQLLRTVPTIQRQTVATLQAAARQGRPITSPLAVQAMAASARNVLGNPHRVGTLVQRNAALRQRVAPPTYRAAQPGMGYPSYRPSTVGRPVTYRRAAR